MKQAERRAKTHALLLETAADEFARSGYAGTTLEQIAAAAGLSKGGIYAHFPTKIALYLAVLEAELAKTGQRLERVADALVGGAQPPTAARRYLGAPDDLAHATFIADLWQVAAAEPLVRERLERFRDARLPRLGAACVDAGYPPAKAIERATTTAAIIDALVLDVRLGFRREA